MQVEYCGGHVLLYGLAINTPWGRVRVVMLVGYHPIALRFTGMRSLALPMLVASASLRQGGEVPQRAVDVLMEKLRDSPRSSTDDCMDM